MLLPYYARIQCFLKVINCSPLVFPEKLQHTLHVPVTCCALSVMLGLQGHGPGCTRGTGHGHSAIRRMDKLHITSTLQIQKNIKLYAVF